MAYTTINKSTDYFNTKLYTGNGSTQSITGVGFQPDWVWIKERNDGSSHAITDAVRGNTKYLSSNTSSVEDTESDRVTGFDSDGFSLGGNVAVNQNTILHASWNWKAGTSFSNDASATGVGDIDSSGSVNTTAGFSIIGYNGNNTSSAGVAHGLGTTPSMIIQKRRVDSVDSVASWRVWHNKIHATSGETKTLLLNTTAANASDNDNISGVSSTTFTGRGAGGSTNPNGSSCITYCFAEKTGYSKFGSYTGNGNADGPFIYTGFTPAFIMCKKYSSTGNWVIQDNKRDNSFNVHAADLNPNLSEAEEGNGAVDFLSNGFKMRNTDQDNNYNGATYIYMAFAEAPLVGTNNVPCNAR